MLWYIKYDDGVDEEEVLIGNLRDCQKLYLKHEGDEVVGNSKRPATGPPKRNTPPSTTKKYNTKQPGYRYANITMKARPLHKLKKLEKLSKEIAILRQIPNLKWNIGVHSVL